MSVKGIIENYIQIRIILYLIIINDRLGVRYITLIIKYYYIILIIKYYDIILIIKEIVAAMLVMRCNYHDPRTSQYPRASSSSNPLTLYSHLLLSANTL